LIAPEGDIRADGPLRLDSVHYDQQRLPSGEPPPIAGQAYEDPYPHPE